MNREHVLVKGVCWCGSAHSWERAKHGTPPTDDEFGITLDPCEHPSINGGVCAVCGATVQ